MLGVLTDGQIEQVLKSQTIGRIACFAEGRLYIVPVTYVYENGYIYAHSKEGMKVSMMRKNPSVCLEVDEIENMANWRSVVVWGKYEELVDEEQDDALRLLDNRLGPLVISESVQARTRPDVAMKGLKAVAFRIRITEMTGRFEKREA